jgi:AAA domain-containing protein
LEEYWTDFYQDARHAGESLSMHAADLSIFIRERCKAFLREAKIREPNYNRNDSSSSTNRVLQAPITCRNFFDVWIPATLLIGDTRQHQGVEAGRPFQQLQEAGMRTAKLEEIVRQKDPALKATVEMLAHGQTTAAIDLTRTRHSQPDCRCARTRPHDCTELRCQSGTDLNRFSDNASRQELNRAVQELKAIGCRRLKNTAFVC